MDDRVTSVKALRVDAPVGEVGAVVSVQAGHVSSIWVGAEGAESRYNPLDTE